MKITLCTFKEIALECDGEIYYKYSGRGMYGKTCIGISCHDATSCIETAASYGVKGAKKDSLGLGSIIYWPEYDFERPESGPDSIED